MKKSIFTILVSTTLIARTITKNCQTID